MLLRIENRSTGDVETIDVGSSVMVIGREDTNDICLPSPFVSRVHARLTPKNGKLFLEPDGLNPTLVNGKEIPPGEEAEVKEGDTIFIQGFMLGLEAAQEERQAEVEALEARAAFSNLVEELHSRIIGRLDPRVVRLDKIETEEGRSKIMSVVDEELAVLDIASQPEVLEYAGRSALLASLMQEILGGSDDLASDTKLGEDARQHGTHEEARRSILRELKADLGLKMTKAAAKEDIRKVREGFDAAIGSRRYDLSPGLLDHLARWDLCKQVCDLIFGLGPLTDLVQMPDINEIMVVSSEQIYIEKSGLLEETGRSFFNDRVGEQIIERIVAPVGRRVDRSMPLVDARLADGSRVNAVIPPVALKGPCITIRKFSPNPLTIDDLIGFGALEERSAGFLRMCIKGRKNFVISGGTGSGKTTLLNALSGWIPDNERIVTIEDNAELKLLQRHVVTLEAKPANVEGQGEISIRDLVRNALRMRPDRIIVGECRGREALDMLQAMNTGHDGSMTTGHANTPRDMLSRLEVMALEAGDMPLVAIRQQIGSAIDIIVQQARLRDGSRKVMSIAEVVGYDHEDEDLIVEDIYLRDGTGPLRFTGYLPTFLEDLVEKGLAEPEDIFA